MAAWAPSVGSRCPCLASDSAVCLATRLMDVALGLGLKAGDMRSLSRSSGMGAGRVKYF